MSSRNFSLFQPTHAKSNELLWERTGYFFVSHCKEIFIHKFHYSNNLIMVTGRNFRPVHKLLKLYISTSLRFWFFLLAVYYIWQVKIRLHAGIMVMSFKAAIKKNNLSFHINVYRDIFLSRAIILWTSSFSNQCTLHPIYKVRRVSFGKRLLFVISSLRKIYRWRHK